MAMLAETIDGVIGVDTQPRHPHGRGGHRDRWAVGPRHRSHRCRRLPGAADVRGRPGAGSALLGDRGSRQLRRRPSELSS
jgi:hypothetical protein